MGCEAIFGRCWQKKIKLGLSPEHVYTGEIMFKWRARTWRRKKSQRAIWRVCVEEESSSLVTTAKPLTGKECKSLDLLGHLLSSLTFSCGKPQNAPHQGLGKSIHHSLMRVNWITKDWLFFYSWIWCSLSLRLKEWFIWICSRGSKNFTFLNFSKLDAVWLKVLHSLFLKPREFRNSFGGSWVPSHPWGHSRRLRGCAEIGQNIWGSLQLFL